MKARASASPKNRRLKGRAPATSAAKVRTSASTLILFDIDGTLVLTGGAGGRAMSRAFEDVFAIANAFAGVPMAGRTDAWILSDAAAAHGVSEDAAGLARFRGAYIRHLAIELEQPGVARKGVMPGVRELLDALSQRDDLRAAGADIVLQDLSDTDRVVRIICSRK